MMLSAGKGGFFCYVATLEVSGNDWYKLALASYVDDALFDTYRKGTGHPCNGKSPVQIIT